MAEFKVIETQEELDSIIGARLERERKAAEKKYEGFEGFKEKAVKYDELLSRDYEGKLKELEGRLEKANKELEALPQLKARAETAEKELLRTRIAVEMKVPQELAGRIAGDTEDDMRKDAETLARFAQPQVPAPLFSAGEQTGRSSADAAYARMSAELMGN